MTTYHILKTYTDNDGGLKIAKSYKTNVFE